MKHIIHLFLLLCLGLNLLAPSLAFVSNTDNQQLLCSSERQLWVSQSESDSEFIATGLALGFSLEQIKEFGDGNSVTIGTENIHGSQYSAGHCPLCVFEHDNLDITTAGFYALSPTVGNEVVNHLSEYYPPKTFYLRPLNKAPPVLFIA